VHTITIIDEDKVVEQGSHSHLLKHIPDGSYARMPQLHQVTSTPTGPSSSS
jgi:ATP-binding cassette, subfamily B (MDR/TAP), member 1